MNTCREIEVVKGSGLKLSIVLDEFTGTAMDLKNLFQGAEVTAGGRIVTIPAEAAYTIDEKRIGIAFSTKELGFGPLEIRAKFHIPDRDFPEDYRVDILQARPDIKIIG